MFAQLLLALLTFIWGVVDYFCIGEKATQLLMKRIQNEKRVRAYRKKRGMIFWLMTGVFICMAILEKNLAPQADWFVLLYIVLAGTVLVLLLIHNVKYLGRWR